MNSSTAEATPKTKTNRIKICPDENTIKAKNVQTNYCADGNNNGRKMRDEILRKKCMPKMRDKKAS